MQLLHTYEDKDEAEAASLKITGQKRLASERDSNQVIYNLFGEATWGNFYKLRLFNLHELKGILDKKQSGDLYDAQRHQEIIDMLKYTAKAFEIEIPAHWL
jgi:hypothetical protein